MTFPSINTTLYRRAFGAVAIVTLLSSCAALDRVGGAMKNAVGLGDCSVPASNDGLVEQAVDTPDEELKNGDRTVMYTSENVRAKKPAGCWWTKSPSQTDVAEETDVADAADAADETDVAKSSAEDAAEETQVAEAETDTQDATAVTASAEGLTEDDVEAATDANPVWEIGYLGIETERLDDDLVLINVRLEGSVDNEKVAAYAECAAAQYTLSRGYGFARHVLTSVSQEDSIWTGKAVFWVSEKLPRGLITIDAAETAQKCFDNGIPTV